MDITDCFRLAAENPYCSLATVDGGKPRVRIFWSWFADESGSYFETLSPKEVTRQLKEGPKVEICHFNNAEKLEQTKSMRLRGKAEFLDDPKLKEKLFADMPLLKQVEPYIEIFRIPSGEAFFWTMSDMLKESEIERIRF